MSSSEFESESVASESSYADYVERLRVKPASLPDVQQFNRPFDSGEGPSEFKSRSSSRDPSKPCSRHSFEPQTRTRAIQIMRGELLDTMVSERRSGDTRQGKKVESFLESRAEANYKQMVSERHGVVTEENMESTKVEQRNPEVQYSEGLAFPGTSMYTESSGSVDLPKTDTSSREKFLSGEASAEDRSTTETGEQYEEEGEGGSLRAHYEKSLDEERMQCEEKLLALRIRKWQQGSMMAEEETFHPETDLPTPAQMQYMEPAGHMHTQQEATQSVTVESETSSFHKSPRVKARMVDPEATTPRSPQVKARGDEAEMCATAEAKSEEVGAQLMLVPKSPRIKARAEMEVELSPKAKARAEDRLGESPG
ncbi:Anhydro-N-acetylmuramic acid kinase [Dissostichus eleginoides]|uniref:Anhydro-N-acetylmuramic acid kinase n=1 Tax=Dissostichus eleginoides TaxID=100907 RepID=A0AAD9B3S6_DISEL|nr:Anhydro-N-acetylmuramic acid kinase [Dissostichus eleginoides]